jgi:hypothetical protein
MNTPTFPPQARFPAMLRPTSDFQAVRDGRSTGPLFVDIDLSTARSVAAGTALELNIAGNLIYFDQRPSSGVATLYLESDDRGMTPLTVFAGWKAQVPFTRVFIENTAQTGNTLRLVYGVDLDLDPGTGAGVTITNPITVIDQIAPVTAHAYLTAAVPVGNQMTGLVVGGGNAPRGTLIKNVYLAGAAGAGGTITLGALAAPFNPFASFGSANNQAYLAVLANWQATVQQVNVTMNRRIPALWWVYVFSSSTVAVGSVECAVEYEYL